MKIKDLEQKAAGAIDRLLDAAADLTEAEKELRRREVRRIVRRERKQEGAAAQA